MFSVDYNFSNKPANPFPVGFGGEPCIMTQHFKRKTSFDKLNSLNTLRAKSMENCR